MSVTPNPLVFTLKSGNKEPIGDEVKIVASGVRAIKVTEGPARWVKLKGGDCESRTLIVGGATCVEKMMLVKFPKVGERFGAEYDIRWKVGKTSKHHTALHRSQAKGRKLKKGQATECCIRWQ